MFANTPSVDTGKTAGAFLCICTDCCVCVCICGCGWEEFEMVAKVILSSSSLSSCSLVWYCSNLSVAVACSSSSSNDSPNESCKSFCCWLVVEEEVS